MIEGACNCGALSYRFSKAVASAICHCRNCQKTSGSAFSVNLIVSEGDIEVTGEEARYEDRSDSGSVVYRCFCPICGSSVRSILTSMNGASAVKAGTLDDPAAVRPTVQFWCRSGQPWLGELSEIPGFATTRTA